MRSAKSGVVRVVRMRGGEERVTRKRATTEGINELTDSKQKSLLVLRWEVLRIKRNY